MAKNSIYSHVRSGMIKDKIEFSLKVPNEVAVLPLGQLEMFLNSKKLFYFDNVKVLQEIEANAPKLISWDWMISHLKRNMIFHESCHFLARREFQKTNGSKSNPTVLQIILEESFANSCELLAIKDVDDQLHKYFYEFNSYIFVPEVKHLIQDLIDQLSLEVVIRWTMICYVYSNYLYDSVPKKDLQRILKVVGIDSKVHATTLKQLNSLGKIAFLLNPDFKMATTAFYLTCHGFTKGLKELRDADFLFDLENNMMLKGAIVSLSKTVV